MAPDPLRLSAKNLYQWRWARSPATWWYTLIGTCITRLRLRSEDEEAVANGVEARHVPTTS